MQSQRKSGFTGLDISAQFAAGVLGCGLAIGRDRENRHVFQTAELQFDQLHERLCDPTRLGAIRKIFDWEEGNALRRGGWQ